MKKLFLITMLLPFVLAPQTYETDVAEIFAGENQVEESLNLANEILCIVSKLRAEQYIDKGPYKANVYPDRCRKQAIQTGSSRQSGSSSGGDQQQQNQQNQVELPSTMLVDVQFKDAQVDGTQPVPEHIEVKSWFFQKGDYSEAQTNYDNLWDAQPDMLIYALTKVYSGAISSDPNGDMELNFLITANCQNAPYATLEDAQNAAIQAGYDSMSWEYFKETENILNVLLQEQFKEAAIFPQWVTLLLFRNWALVEQRMDKPWVEQQPQIWICMILLAMQKFLSVKMLKPLVERLYLQETEFGKKKKLTA